MESFSDYLKSLTEEEEGEVKDLHDCREGDEKDDDLEDEKDDEDGDDIKESAQIQLDLLKQIQPKLSQAPLNVLKQVLKRLEAGDKGE